MKQRPAARPARPSRPVLDPAHRIRMANPSSPSRRPYAVRSRANLWPLRWDTFGIAAALHVDELDPFHVRRDRRAAALRLSGGACKHRRDGAFPVHFSNGTTTWCTPEPPSASSGRKAAARVASIDPAATRDAGAAQVLELSKLWYPPLAPDYHGRTAEQVAAIFQQVGLTSAFWLAS